MQAVAVPARIDAENAVSVLESLSQAMAAAGSISLALDLAPLQHFDSSALSLLLQLARGRRGAEPGPGLVEPGQPPERQPGKPLPAGAPLFLLNPPGKLRELADLYGVAEMLFGVPAKLAT